MWNKKIIYELKIVFRKIFPKRIYNILPIIKPIKGRALVAYIPDGVLWEDDDERFSGHTNKWESAQIVKILSKLGYVVDAISHDDTRYKKNLKYDLIIDIGNNAFRFSKQYKDARIIIHSTGSHLRYQNQAEITRLKELERRSGVLLKPRRWQIKMTELQYNLGLEIASLVTLIGNDVTLSTYPQNIQKKIVKIPVTGSSITYVRDLSNIKFQSEYLWFAGSGAVHKGLDLVIDVFKSIENVRLHIIGSYQSEDDFINLYGI